MEEVKIPPKEYVPNFCVCCGTICKGTYCLPCQYANCGFNKIGDPCRVKKKPV